MISRPSLFSALLLFTLGVAEFAAAKMTPEAAPIVRALEARYHDAKTLKAVFLERYSDGRQSAQVESGTVYFSRPGRMRWEYESPERKLFLSDGKTVWFFVPADHTVTRAPMKESTDWRTPLVLLTGRVKLSELCDQIDVASQRSETPGHVILRCLPRGEKRLTPSTPQPDDPTAGIASPTQPFDQVLIEVDAASGELADVRVLQPGGVELEYRFGNWEQNLPLPTTLFHFQPPIGVAIVDALEGSSPAP